jgi:hypothetical protein
MTIMGLIRYATPHKQFHTSFKFHVDVLYSISHQFISNHQIWHNASSGPSASQIWRQHHDSIAPDSQISPPTREGEKHPDLPPISRNISNVKPIFMLSDNISAIHHISKTTTQITFICCSDY